MSFLYAIVCLIALLGVISLAVDFGRVQVAKSQLQTSADAAARYAASGLQNQIDGISAASDNAASVVAQNIADGRAISFNKSTDVVIGVWNSSNNKFTANSNLNVANAVKVTLQCSATRGTAVPLTFLALLGRGTKDISATSIAIIDYSAVASAAGNGSFEYYIPADSNPWLAGASSGTVANNNNPHNNPDYAGSTFTDSGAKKNGNVNASDYTSKKNSPIKAGGITVTPGATLTFDGVNGGANNFASNTVYDGDGNLDWMTDNLNGNENGIANLTAPINSVIGVFISNSTPSNSSAPSALDFSTQSARDYDTLSPQLKQPFFIGDGRKSTGEVQHIVVPPGATRFYIATMDGWEWNNNVGGFTVTTHISGKVMSAVERQ